MAARLLSRVAFHLPLFFCPEKVRSQFAVLSPHQRENTVVIVPEEVVEWSRCTFYDRRLRYEFPGR